ncbi:MAG: FN3 associated domain-containing protein, partial [Methylobacter sp.]
NDLDVKDEIGRIAPFLQPAMSHDIADSGNSVSEAIDNQLSSDAATQVSSLLLASSLSRAVGGRIGLTEGEIIEFLAAPNRKPDEFVTALEKLKEQAWYLHREDQRYFIKETENLSRKIERNARDIPQPKIDQALIYRLTGLLQPVSKAAYQELKVLPLLDEIRLTGTRVLLVVRPDGKLPPQQLNNFFLFQQEKNNLLVLSGQDSHFADAVEDRLRELYAVEQIVKHLKDGDTLYEEARERLEDAEQRFMKALSAAYNRLYFPGKDDSSGDDVLLMVTVDNGLKVGTGEQSAEKQIEELLASPRANYKLALDVKSEIVNYLAQAEVYLWPERDRRTPWKDVQMRAKTNPEWPWMPGSAGMDMLKTEALKQGRWRQGEDGYIEKGPFPKEKTTLNIAPQGFSKDSGEPILMLTPRNCGASPVVYYSQNANVSTTDPVVDDLDSFTTNSATLYFLAVDSEGKHEIGEPKRWIADLIIRHQLHVVADKRRVELKCVPPADIYYTLNGSNPKEGIRYEAPFDCRAEVYRLLVFAKAGEATKNTEFNIPASGDKRIQIDDNKPACLLESKRINLDNTEKVFAVLNRFRDRSNTLLKGVRIQIGEGENTVQVRFHERQVTAQMIEDTVNSLRKVLNDDQAQISIDIVGGIQFGDGYALKEFAELSGLQLKPGDVIQEA